MNATERIVFALAALFFGLAAMACAGNYLREGDLGGSTLGPVIGFWGAAVCLGLTWVLDLLADIRGHLREMNLRQSRGGRRKDVEVQRLWSAPRAYCPHCGGGLDDQPVECPRCRGPLWWKGTLPLMAPPETVGRQPLPPVRALRMLAVAALGLLLAGCGPATPAATPRSEAASSAPSRPNRGAEPAAGIDYHSPSGHFSVAILILLATARPPGATRQRQRAQRPAAKCSQG